MECSFLITCVLKQCKNLREEAEKAERQPAENILYIKYVLYKCFLLKDLPGGPYIQVDYV